MSMKISVLKTIIEANTTYQQQQLVAKTTGGIKFKLTLQKSFFLLQE